MTRKERQAVVDASDHLLGAIDRAELWCIAEALIVAQGKYTLAAELLGVQRNWLLRRLRRSGILRRVRSTAQQLVP